MPTSVQNGNRLLRLLDQGNFMRLSDVYIQTDIDLPRHDGRSFADARLALAIAF